MQGLSWVTVEDVEKADDEEFVVQVPQPRLHGHSSLLLLVLDLDAILREIKCQVLTELVDLCRRLGKLNLGRLLTLDADVFGQYRH